MILRHWAQLAATTVKDPARAADILLAQPVDRGVLWSALVLASALNAILFALSNILLPTPQVFPGFLYAPLAYFALVTLGLAAFIQFLTWIGRLLGGQGGFADVMVLVVWLQVLRVVVQAATLLLVLTIPLASLVLVLAASLAGLYILLHFIARAHRLPSLGRAAAILILTMLAMAFAMSVVLALVGAPMMGSDFNV